MLGRLFQGSGSLSTLLPAASQQLEAKDRGLLQELCFGVCRYYPLLDGIVCQLLNKPLKHKDADVLALLYLGIYQLRYMRVPDHAAIASTVDAAKPLRKLWAKNLVNGVLREYQRRADELLDALNDAASHAHPDWLYGKLRKQWPEQAEGIFSANNTPPPMTLRVNTQQQSRDDYQAQLAQAGIDATPCQWSEVGIQLGKACDVNQLPGFAEGSCSVQDEASQLVAPLVLAEKPQRVLDACSAPGGKTCHLLESNADLYIDAVDIEGQRLARVEDNLARLNLQANLIQGDASQPASWWDGELYDAILLDAPCSATGVIRRHPDIKVLREPDDLDKLTPLQGQLLDALWQCLRPGGRLVYTTCSVLREENERVVGAFVEREASASITPIAGEWGIDLEYGRQLLPGADEHDGFYYACLQKAGK